MSEVIITVRGEHDLRAAPERGTVHLSVGFDGADRRAVTERVLLSAAAVREAIIAHERSGAVTLWSSRRLEVHAERPWNHEGRQQPPVYRAAVAFAATFADLDEMSAWAGAVAEEDGVTVADIGWQLTPQTERELERRAAVEAVGIAVSRARAYAEALGLQTVTPKEIADQGLIASEPPFVANRAAAFDSATPALALSAEEIVVSARVEGRFSAS